MRRAFTLIELLTVIAISGILLTLIILPVFQSFNLTRNAQAFADAQEKGRLLTERISREISSSVIVRNPSGRIDTIVNGTTVPTVRGGLVIRVPRVNADGTTLPSGSTDTREVLIPYAKIDLVAPDVDGEIRNGAFVDPVTGREDPTLRSRKGPVALPLTAGQTITRYWVGLRDPFLRYANPYDGLLAARGAERDNLFVLFKARVNAMEYRTLSDGSSRYVSNPEFFFPAPGTQIAGVTDQATGRPVGTSALLDDPRFFQPILPNGTIDTTREDMARRWLARAVIQTEVSRYDMIQPEFNRANRRVVNVNGTPAIQPLIQFRPSRVASEPAKGDVSVRLGEESAGAAGLAPDSFRTRFGLWTDAIVRTYPAGWTGTQPYLVGRSDFTGLAPGFSVYAYDPSLGNNDVVGGTELFDITTYEETRLGRGRYPFSAAVDAANGRSGWVGNAALRRLFRPYTVDVAKGRVITSFGLNEVGDRSAGGVDPGNPDNLPTFPGSIPADPQAYTPTDDPRLAASPVDVPSLFQPEFRSVNTRFNKLFDVVRRDTGNTTGLAGVDPSRIHRFVDLRTVVQGDGAAGPLDVALGLNARIVPGSEVIMGPDQNPGPGYGQRVRYVRVTGGVEPGPNQYRINYVDLPEPANYALIGVTGQAAAGFDPNVYSPTQPISVFFQAQYKAGYVQFCSDPNVPIPHGGSSAPLSVFYRFQFNGSAGGADRRTDVFAVDYDSRQLMQVLLTIRNYPQASTPNPQTVTLKATANLRNYLR